MYQDSSFRLVRHYLGKIEISQSNDTNKLFLTVFLNDDKVDETNREFYKFFTLGYLVEEGFLVEGEPYEDMKLIFKNEKSNVIPSKEWDNQDDDEEDN